MTPIKSVCLKASCTPVTKAAIKALACDKGISVATLLRQMVEHELRSSGKELGRELTCDRGGRGGRLTVRLTNAEVAQVRALAKPAGQSASGWVVAQVRQHLGHAVPFSERELDELDNAVQALNAVGRNLNMTTAYLMRTGHYAEAWEPQRLEKVVYDVRDAVQNMAHRATHRMGEDDAEQDRA